MAIKENKNGPVCECWIDNLNIAGRCPKCDSAGFRDIAIRAALRKKKRDLIPKRARA